jgi:hypothetical protein
MAMVTVGLLVVMIDGRTKTERRNLKNGAKWREANGGKRREDK